MSVFIFHFSIFSNLSGNFFLYVLFLSKSPVQIFWNSSMIFFLWVLLLSRHNYIGCIMFGTYFIQMSPLYFINIFMDSMRINMVWLFQFMCFERCFEQKSNNSGICRSFWMDGDILLGFSCFIFFIIESLALLIFYLYPC